MVAVAANAQEYKKFRWANGLGYAKPDGSGGSGGVLWATEFGYRVKDPLCVSLRIEGAVVVRGFSESGTANDDAEAKAVASYTANAIYYFSDQKFRPYVGLGAGIYSLAGAAGDVNGSVAVSASESKFGFYPRIGFDLGHFNLNIDYNIIGESNIYYQGSTADLTIKNSYIGIRVGGYFFGGRN